MSRMIFTTLAFILSCSFVCGEVLKSASATAKPLLDSYNGCVVGHAKALAGSPDSTEHIVKGAMGACAVEKRALSEALRVAGVSSDELAGFINKFDGQVFEAASQAVLEERDAH